MDVKKLVLLIGALDVAAVTAIMAKNMFTGASAETAAATSSCSPPWSCGFRPRPCSS